MCKSRFLLPQDTGGNRPWTGASVHRGAGGTGDEEAGEGLKPDEEDVGNRVEHSPSAETKGNGLKSMVNTGRICLMLSGSAQESATAARAGS
jgi:hypothetical protein